MALGKYSPRDLVKGLRNPQLIKTEFKKIIAQRVYAGENFMEKDWDTLIILDACRPDFFEKYNPFEEDYRRISSLGAGSREYFYRTFKNGNYHDIVYVTGNGHIEKVNDDKVFKFIKTYSDNLEEAGNQGWSPETVFNATLEAHQEYPDKRIVAHFMQPHVPYLGEYANKLRQQVMKEHCVYFNHSLIDDNLYTQEDSEVLRHLLQAYEYGYISTEEIKIAYGENVKFVLEYVEDLINQINGKITITADHSESFGDFNGIYGHKNWAFADELREVPWLEMDGDRRRTFSEQPIDSESVDRSTVQENLKDLGYL